MAYNANLAPGQASQSASSPVALATEQVQDTFITGATAQSTAGVNLLLASSDSVSIDCVAPSGASYRSFYVQINGSAGISSGAIIFEGSNDNTNFVMLAYLDDSTTVGNVINVASTVTASQVRFFSGKIIYRYLRCRISTAFVGGTVQAFTKLSPLDYLPKLFSVASYDPARFNVTATPATPSNYNLLTSATTNAASLKASAGTLFEVTLSNPTATPIYVKFFNKASAPTVGTDVPVFTLSLPATSATVYPFGEVGKRFSTGIAIAATAAFADNDTGVGVAGAHINATYI